MISLLLAATLLGSGGQIPPGGTRIVTNQLPEPNGAPARLQTYWKEEPLPSPKLSPKKFAPLNEPYSFDWVSAGFVRSPGSEEWSLRFRLYSQIKPTGNDDVAFATLRALLRSWQIAEKWGLDHRRDVPYGVVDVYLCWGGKAGGEQLLDHDPQVPRGVEDLVNTIYIYDLPSFSGPVERLREVAHEYGHALLPAVGGYSSPESWANGVLGERLFLRRLLAERRSRLVSPTETFDAPEADLAKWVAQNVEPAERASALAGPRGSRLDATDGAAMDRFVGLGTYLEAILPPKAFGRALKLMEKPEAQAIVRAASLAVEERPSVTLRIPASLRGETVWVPIGGAKISGATVVARESGWARIKIGKADPVLINPSAQAF